MKMTPQPAVALEIRWVASTSPDQARLGALAFLDALRHLEDPFDLSFRISATAGTVSAALVVGGWDDAQTARAAERVLAVAAGCLPWYGLEQVPVGADFTIPKKSNWVSRVSGGGSSDNRVAIDRGSPVSTALEDQDAIISVALIPSTEDDSRGADVLILSDAAPTDVLAGLAALEVGGPQAPLVVHATGEGSAELVAGHGFAGKQPLKDVTLAEFLSLPLRIRGGVSWNRVPIRPASESTIVETLDEAPELHRWIIGRTGTGKTTLLEHLLIADARAGKSIVLIDPHGDLAPSLMDSLPLRELERVEYLDFASRTPPSYNLLRPESGQTRAEVVNEVSELVRALFETMPEEFFGPVFYRVLRWALNVVIAAGEGGNLGDVVRVLSGDGDYIEEMLARSSEQELRRAWTSEMRHRLGTPSTQDCTTYVASKLDPFLSDTRLRAIFAGPLPNKGQEFSIVRSLHNHKIVLARLPVGVLGLAAVRALGSTLISRAAGSLGRAFEDRTSVRGPLALYVDEWQLVAQSTVERLLAEGRKYGFELTIANQALSQLRRPGSVISNVGTVACFRLGAGEAALLAPEFPTMSQSDLRGLPPFWVALRPPSGLEIVGRSPAPPRGSQVPNAETVDDASPMSSTTSPSDGLAKVLPIRHAP